MNADTPGPRKVERPWGIPCQCDHRYAEHIAGSGCRLCECRQYAERAGSPATAAGKLLLMAGLAFHSGKRLADYPELILAIEAEAVANDRAAIAREHKNGWAMSEILRRRGIEFWEPSDE